MWETARDSLAPADGEPHPIPGALVVWSGATPRLVPMRIPSGGLVLGRESLAMVDDDRLSRQHVRIQVAGDQLRIADLGSRNGTHVGGRLIAGEILAAPPAVVRAGRTIVVAIADLRPFEHAVVDPTGGPHRFASLIDPTGGIAPRPTGEAGRVPTPDRFASLIDREDGAVVGPSLRPAWNAIAQAAHGRSLLVTGESGTGKELAARAFHRAAGGGGELVAVNCAAIPAGVAERLLFGTRKGAYSGADKDADGYLAAADGGTLFLDEIAELELEVQAKLLRVLETGELLALGAARPRPVNVRIVAATLRDLRGAVAAGRFRDDLYYRIGRPEVRLPPLRERLEEIPWLCEEAVRASGRPAHPSLVEACLVRPWPGNVRELLGDVGRAAHAAAQADRPAVRADDLDPHAGRPAVPSPAPGSAPAIAVGASLTRSSPTAPPSAPAIPTPPADESSARAAALPDDAVILAALRGEGGNVSRAARRLGLHRNQLRRWLARHPDEDSSDSEDPSL